LAYECVDAFIRAKFISGEERFVRRFKKVMAIEAKYQCGDGSANPA
jgi:ribose 5-phosphate isomerase B